MINEHLEEQAALYVLGALAGPELIEFEMALPGSPELQQLVIKLSLPVEALAGAVPQTSLPPGLRAKILGQIEPRQKTVSFPDQKSSWRAWFSWSLAAGLAVLCFMSAWQGGRLQKKIEIQSRQINELNQTARTLQSARGDLQKLVLALRESNRLANVQITLLSSLLVDSPKAMAVTLWDNEKQHGVFVAQNMKELPTGKDYQLWVLDNGVKPVDAGIFHVDKTGTGRVEFKARELVKIAGKFAVTEENKGGAASPTLKNMVLLGNSL
ncbi:MAG TPA: anti-sigma factor [Verrucomicrobiae bacterium]|jgi:anti-sigma-K factor RskA